MLLCVTPFVTATAYVSTDEADPEVIGAVADAAK